MKKIRFLVLLLIFLVYVNASKKFLPPSPLFLEIDSKPKFPQSSSSTEPPLTCKDGREPLLEGDNNVFQCVDECPDGFDCETPRNDTRGICCPDIEILYEIYGSSEEEVTEASENATSQVKVTVEKTTTVIPSTTISKPNPWTTEPIVTTGPLSNVTKPTVTKKPVGKKQFGVKTFVVEVGFYEYHFYTILAPRQRHFGFG